jgi:hypothetical protein
MRHALKGPGGFLLGLGIAAAVPIVLPIVSAVARPLAKAAIKNYLGMKESVESAVKETRERWNRLVSEARAERASGQPPAPPSAPM